MSIFNRAYKSDADLEMEEVERRRKEKMRKRQLKNKIAQDIYLAVIDEIEAGTDNFTKAEMVELVAGSYSKTDSEWVIYDKACNVAISRIRRYYWCNKKTASTRRMFNFDREEGRYWLIEIDDSNRTNRVFTSYERKVIGINSKMIQIADSVYQRALELDPVKRAELLERLKEIDKLAKNPR